MKRLLFFLFSFVRVQSCSGPRATVHSNVTPNNRYRGQQSCQKTDKLPPNHKKCQKIHDKRVCPAESER